MRSLEEIRRVNNYAALRGKKLCYDPLFLVVFNAESGELFKDKSFPTEESAQRFARYAGAEYVGIGTKTWDGSTVRLPVEV